MQRLSEATAELQKYRQAFGGTGNQPPEVTLLVAQLRQKDGELEKLQLVARELEAVCRASPAFFAKLMGFPRISPLYIQSWINLRFNGNH